MHAAGELRVVFHVQPLDRDEPNGAESWEGFISATDDGDQSTVTEVWITLTDINDNAPFLKMVSECRGVGGGCNFFKTEI